MTTSATDESLPLRSDEDIVRARQLVRARTAAMGFSLVDQTKIVTAASELARNAVLHGGGGTMHLRVLSLDGRSGIELEFVDEGPGIAEIELALRDGYSTRGGLGLGLSGSRRLMHDFEIRSAPGQGTRVRTVRWS